MESDYFKNQLSISIDPENFGAICSIESVDFITNTAIVNTIPEPIFNISNLEFISKVKILLRKPLYNSFYDYDDACWMLGISPKTFDRILDSIQIKRKEYDCF